VGSLVIIVLPPTSVSGDSSFSLTTRSGNMVGGTFERFHQIGRGRNKASLEAQMPVDSNFQFVRGHAMNCVSALGIGDV